MRPERGIVAVQGISKALAKKIFEKIKDNQQNDEWAKWCSRHLDQINREVNCASHGFLFLRWELSLPEPGMMMP